MLNNGIAPTLDGVQSQVGNMPVFQADPVAVERKRKADTTLKPQDHSNIYTMAKTTGYEGATSDSESFGNPYANNGEGDNVKRS